jgi:hypothetical protein
MENINYKKNNNHVLFKDLENTDYANMYNIQNYVPIYNHFFSLNDNNYNLINLNLKYNLKKIISCDNDKKPCRTFKAIIESNEDKNIKHIFCKYSPLLDPLKYMTSKYSYDDSLYNLPNLNNNDNVHPKLLDTNNVSYTDCLFYYLSNTLNEKGFVNSLEFYGTFLGIQKNFTINIEDDIEYLVKSEEFHENLGIHYNVEDINDLAFNDDDESGRYKEKLDINDDINIEVDLSLNNENDPSEVSDNVFTFNLTEQEIKINDNNDQSINLIDEDNLSSSDSSDESDTDDDDDNTSTLSDKSQDDSSDVSDESNISELQIEATINKFPVQAIFIEKCDNTLDSYLMESEELSYDIWISILIQIIMTLLIYQKKYEFTHNDLHTNNIMYINTKLKYLYYKYNDKLYKVPTFGKIYKIIDFGRAIYSFNGKRFCSDSFSKGEDAYTQYNCEPYFNEKKKTIEPNYSFDLCRLGCSLFDFFIEDLNNVKEICSKNKIAKLVNEWCTDDKGKNVLYKNNGEERYPDFKLYKMIARTVNKHTPENQLNNKLFSTYICNKKEKCDNIMDIDTL